MAEIFEDRIQAGRLLAKALRERGYGDLSRNPVVVALPRGGVPIGHELARELGIPLDILIVRKIGAPQSAEFGIGALAEDGTKWINREAASLVGATEEQLQKILQRESAEISRRTQRFRGGRPMIPVAGRTVILCDDGLATGVTAMIAVRSLRFHGARRIVVAVPVAARDSVDLLRREADEVICLEAPEEFYAVGQWYEDFEQLSDEDVMTYLKADKPLTRSQSEVSIDEDNLSLSGDLTVPATPLGLVIFAHGSGSSRKSPRNRQVARKLNEAGLATLLFDLLTDEESEDRDNVFDIDLLADRLISATQWAEKRPEFRDLKICYFGASTGAAAALVAAARLGNEISSIVSRGGRPDLASSLSLVKAPTLLIVGGADTVVLALNRQAELQLENAKLLVIPRATHLFEESGALEQVAAAAADWFARSLETLRKTQAV